MGDLHYPDLHIKGFRGFKDLEIHRLGRVTLITGKNNTGKSSILEALRLHSHGATPQIVYEILAFREEHIRDLDEPERSPNPDGVFHISTLFHKFPRISEDFGPIVISTNGKSFPRELTIEVNWYAEEEDDDGTPRLVPRQRGLFGESDGVAALVVGTEGRKRPYRLDRFIRNHSRRLGQYRVSPDDAQTPCLLVSPYGGESTSALGPLWDDIALTENEKDVVEALRFIDPEIMAVSMVGGEAYPHVRRAIVRANDIPRPVPLRSFGDGMNRLFAIVLSLVNSRGGVLLVDEFETGLHHSVQLDAWRMVFRLAQSLDVQVFATTHSQDAIRAFQKAAAESSEDGVLLRLTRKGDVVIPTVANEDELAVATRHDIEVR